MMSEVRVCPECDSPEVRHRGRGTDTLNRLAEPDSDHRCESCGATFDEPVTREPHGGGDTAAGVLSRVGFGHLADDEVGTDTGRPLSALERDLLLIVAHTTAASETPATVAEAWKQLGQLRDVGIRSDDWPVRNTVRDNLNRIADAGLVHKTQSRNGNTYRLSSAGRQRLREREQQLATTLQALDMPDGGGADE